MDLAQTPSNLRLTKQAYDQDALLSYEDLAVLLTTISLK